MNIDLEDWVEDAAYDFAEQVVGRFDFPINWRKLSTQYADRLSTVRTWMLDHGFDASRAHDVISVLDRLADKNVAWRR
jgi:hypothetical protein